LKLQEKTDIGGSAVSKFSICDPTVIKSLPRKLQNGVVDAYTRDGTI
jgi:alcohol dehydrogenase YqhD (iron-dependent ADH family)